MQPVPVLIARRRKGIIIAFAATKPAAKLPTGLPCREKTDLRFFSFPKDPTNLYPSFLEDRCASLLLELIPISWFHAKL